MRVSDRRRLYPSIGFLYPEGTAALTDVGNETGLGDALDPYPVYKNIWAVHTSQGVEMKSIDDAFYERDVRMLELAFESQMHFGNALYEFGYACYFVLNILWTDIFICAMYGRLILGCFYAYVKLKEQEIRNIVWISECLVQRQKDAINNFIPLFSENAPWRQ